MKKILLATVAAAALTFPAMTMAQTYSPNATQQSAHPQSNEPAPKETGREGIDAMSPTGSVKETTGSGSAMAPKGSAGPAGELHQPNEVQQSEHPSSQNPAPKDTGAAGIDK